VSVPGPLRRAAWFFAALVLATRDASAQRGAAAPTESKTARVTYVAGTAVYVDAGSDDGIAEGDVVTIVRGGQDVTTLRVEYISSHRSSGSVAPGSAPVQVGDAVRYTPHALPPPAAAPADAPPPVATRPGSGLHGRVGARYFVVEDRSGPGLDLLLTGRSLGGAPVDLDVDVRAARTTSHASDGTDVTESYERVYRLAASVKLPGNAGRVAAGRQIAPALSALSLFDGVTYAGVTPRWGGGVFAGFQPDLVDFGFSTDVAEYGGYVEVHNRPGDRTRWSFVTGVVGSVASGEVNRDFLYLQGHCFSPRFALFTSAVVDFNRGWKTEEAGESTLELTGGFASLRYTATKWLRLFGGYDNRRNVRLFRDRTTPIDEFDDSFRQGMWGGASVYVGRYAEGSVEARRSTGGPSGTADSYSISVGAANLSRALVDVRLRGTHFSNVDSSGELYALSSGCALGRYGHVEVYVGRQDLSTQGLSLETTRQWYRVDLEVDLGWRWFILLSFERDTGDDEEFDQAGAAVTYRF
jgi:hypothetical protein